VGSLDGTGRGEDDFAMLRDEREFRNVHLVEQERGDFAREMARLLWFSAWQVELHGHLARGSSDEMLAGVSGKALKEVRYHLDHAVQWVVRLGDGTAESHERMQAALEWVAPYVDEVFDDDPLALAAVEAGVLSAPPSAARPAVQATVEKVLDAATLTPPEAPRWRSRGGRSGVHSRPMGFLLAEMQHIARSHPGATW
jgi:ring-1,2-phenylacetyl-CoA epoxidase subunit PaaC